ncbi:MAG TPA: hypothetical protein VNZ53_24320 [Steroidobacteraceae bacterium]|nr:hypothetical protein [Steroidobacteraceae bacterium]
MVGNVKVRRNVSRARNPRVKTSNATFWTKVALELGQRSFALTTVMYKLRRRTSSAETAYLPRQKEGPNLAKAKSKETSHQHTAIRKQRAKRKVRLPERAAAGHRPAPICKDGGVVAG